MSLQSNKQLKILKLMGVDVWRLRQPHEVSDAGTLTGEDHLLDGENSDVPEVISEVAADIIWVSKGRGNPEARWLFICQDEQDKSGGLFATESVHSRLLDAILLSLELKRDDIFSFVATCKVPSDIAEAPLQTSIEEFLAKHTPQNIIVMGQECAAALLGTDKSMQTLRGETYRHPVSNSKVRVTYSLDWLLNHPLDKALLWDDLIKARG